jgi:hypothetical protein
VTVVAGEGSHFPFDTIHFRLAGLLKAGEGRHFRNFVIFGREKFERLGLPPCPTEREFFDTRNKLIEGFDIPKE